MTYRDSLYPWCVISKLPKLQSAVVRRCRKRNEAEEQLRLLQHLNPGADYEIVFDVYPDRSHFPLTISPEHPI